MSHVVAVAGPPGAGKTSLVIGLARVLGNAGVLHMDSYENMTRMPMDALKRWMREGADIDAFAFPRLLDDLARLKHENKSKYVLFETQFGRAHSATGAHVDLVIWVDTPLDVALARNIKATLGGLLGEPQPERMSGGIRWLHGYLENYLGTVRALLEMQRTRVCARADVVLDGHATLEQNIERACAEIRRRLP